VSIDDNEQHVLRVLMDEVFGQHNFVANIIWQKNFSPRNTRTLAGSLTEDPARCVAPVAH